MGVEETEESEREKIIELPCVHEGDDKIELLEQIRTDQTLKPCRDLVTKREWGYRWENGLLLHKIVDLVHEEVERIVLPKVRLNKVMELAHDRLGYLGHRKVTQRLKKKFTWPLMSKDFREYCSSCNVCQRFSRKT